MKKKQYKKTEMEVILDEIEEAQSKINEILNVLYNKVLLMESKKGMKSWEIIGYP